MRLLGDFLGQLVGGTLSFVALGVELAPVVGGQLRQFPFRLIDAGPGGFDDVGLRRQLLLLFDAFALQIGRASCRERV